MKNLLQSDLKVVAEKILATSSDVSVSELQHLAQKLYEKLTVLEFVNSNLSEELPPKETSVVENNAVVQELPIQEEEISNLTEEPSSIEDSEMLSTLDENLFVSDEELYVEPATEKMIDIVAQMPQETQQVDDLFETITAPIETAKNDMNAVTPTQEDINEAPKSGSLNDRLKKGITIGLNDRIAFVKHLFNGSTEDFNRVISQLNTLNSELEALEFLNGMVKPEYNNWTGKEAYEERLISFIEGKY
ncbi:MAG: hypothetical protein ACPG45_03985 [Flavobacteriaceae bacterium]